MTTTVLTTKISEVENKIPDISGLVTATVLNTEINKVIEDKIRDHDKCIATSEFNKFAEKTFDTELKEANSATNSDNLLTKIKKVEKLKIFDFFFLVKMLFVMVFKICLFINQHLKC